MPFLRTLDKPEYFFRPSQLFRRLSRPRPVSERRERVTTPWGLPLEVNIGEAIGTSLWHLGVYDLVVSEALWRLADEGDRLVDVGANIGYTTSLLAARAGSRGRVTSFEPHPRLFAELQRNVDGWRRSPAGLKLGPIELVPAAVAAEAGRGALCIPRDFDRNAGLARLGAKGEAGDVAVDVVSLDEHLGTSDHVGLMKVDTEGGEARVFEGARNFLESRRIRDVVFEDHERYPSTAMRILENAGYCLYRLKKSFLGPRLLSPLAPVEAGMWEPVSYVATFDPVRLTERLKPRGWRVLRG